MIVDCVIVGFVDENVIVIFNGKGVNCVVFYKFYFFLISGGSYLD